MIKRIIVALLVVTVCVFFAPQIYDFIGEPDEGVVLAKGKGHSKGNGKGHSDRGRGCRGKGRSNGHGYGHDRGTPDLSIPEVPETRDASEVADAPMDTTTPESFEGNEPIPTRGCNTSWERATYPGCSGLPYHGFLQGHPDLLGYPYAVPVFQSQGDHYVAPEEYDKIFGK